MVAAFRRLFDKFQTSRTNHTFTDTDRKKSEMKREENSLKAAYFEVQKEIMQAKREELEELKAKIQIKTMDEKIERLTADLYDDDDDDDEAESFFGLKGEDAALITGLTNLAQKTGLLKTQSTYTPSSPTTSAIVDVSDDEIKNFISKIDKTILKTLKKKSNDELINIISSNYAGITEKTANRAAEMIKNG